MHKTPPINTCILDQTCSVNMAECWPNSSLGFTKEIKNAVECIVELYKHAGIFKNTGEVHREAAECALCTSLVFLNSRVLI